MNEQIVKVISEQCIRPAVKQPRALIPDHLPGQEGDGVRRAAVVEDVQLPLLGDGLSDVQDGGDHVRREPETRGLENWKLLKGKPRPVNVRDEPGPVCVPPDAVCRGVLQPHPGPALRQGPDVLPQPLLDSITAKVK